MAGKAVRHGLVLGVAAVLAIAGMAEAKGGRGGGNSSNHGNSGYRGGGNSSYHGNSGYRGGGHSSGHHNSGHSNRSSSSFSFSIGVGSYGCGSGYSVGYGYSSGGWCGSSYGYRSTCNSYVPRCGYIAARPAYVCAPRYVVAPCAPTYVVIERPVTRVEYVVSDASAGVTTVRTAQANTDFRAWQAQTQLAERAATPEPSTTAVAAAPPADPPANFTYVVEAPEAVRLPAGSINVHGRAPLPETPVIATATPADEPAATPVVPTPTPTPTETTPTAVASR